MRALLALVLFASLLVLIGSSGLTVRASEPATTTTTANGLAAAACASSVGPGIPPPTTVPSGVPGFHASWYGQSGYMTLCPGDTMTAVVAMYNSGSAGWVKAFLGQVAYLGTWVPTPGQDQPSVLGGDGQLGSPSTGWPRYNRVAVQPADYVGPNQVSWFQFAVKAPATPGTYTLYIRPLIEGAQWMEDYGIYWQITVPSPVAVGPPAKLSCSATPASIVAGTTQTSTLTVSVQDTNGQVVTTDSSTSIVVSQTGTTSRLDGQPSGAASSKTDANGTATFSLAAPPAGTLGTDQLSANAANLQGCLANVAFTNAGAPTSLGVTLGQTEFPTGRATASTVTATFRDASGAATSFPSTTTTVTFSVDNTSICTVSPTTATIPPGTTATTSTLTMTGAPGSCTVTASAPTVTSGTATATAVGSGPAAQLIITGNTCTNTPTTSSTPGSTCDLTVQVQDTAGNKVFGPTPVTLSMYRPSTTTNCGATVVSTTPAGGSGNPATGNTASSGTTVKFTLSDAVAESCTATASATAGVTPASAAISFTGVGAPTALSAAVSPNPIPRNGASSSTITICVKDAAGNTVTTANDSISLVFTSTTGVASARATSGPDSSPKTASGGCAAFTVTSTTNPAATDTYTATDTSRTVTGTTAAVTTQ